MVKSYQPAPAPARTLVRGFQWAFAVLLASGGPTQAAGQVSPTAGSGTVAGVVVDGESGAPVSRALLLLEPLMRQATTDPLGRFEFDAVPDGLYRLSVRAFGFAQRSLELASPGADQLRIELAADPILLDELNVVSGPGVIRGTVRDAQSTEPIGYVAIALTEGGGDAVGRAVSDTLGRFEIGDVEPGYYFLQPRYAGYETFYLPVLVSGEEQIDLVLEPDSLFFAGLPLIRERWRGRRNAYQGIAVAYGPEEINRYDRRSAFHFLTFDTWALEGASVIIDDVILCFPDAMEEFLFYEPSDFFSIEVFGRDSVRAYTHAYAEDQARTQAVEPGLLAHDRVCFRPRP